MRLMRSLIPLHLENAVRQTIRRFKQHATRFRNVTDFQCVLVSRFRKESENSHGGEFVFILLLKNQFYPLVHRDAFEDMQHDRIEAEKIPLKPGSHSQRYKINEIAHANTAVEWGQAALFCNWA